MLDQPPLPEPFPSLPLRYDDDVYQCPITGASIYKDVTRNLAQRASINAIDNPQDQAEFARHCSKSFILWLNLCGWTFRQHEVLPDGTRAPVAVAEVPFITWPVQDHAATKIINCIRNGRDVLIDKSRDMGASWLCLSVITWMMLFEPNFTAKILSRKEEEVDSTQEMLGVRGVPDTLFWKIRYMVSRQPAFLRALLDDSYMRVTHQAMGSMVGGESTNKNAGRGGRCKVTLLDECSVYNDLAAIDASTESASSCRIFNATPVGPGYYSDLRFGGKIEVVVLGFWNHPEKGLGRRVVQEEGKLRWTSPARELAKSKQSSKVIAQNWDIDHERAGDAFFDLPILLTHKATHADTATPRDGQLLCRMEGSELDLYLREFLIHRRIAWGMAPHAMGPLRIWCPMTVGPDKRRLMPPRLAAYAMGVDIAQGVGASNSSICIINQMNGQQVAEYTSSTVEPSKLARIAAMLGYWFCGVHECALLAWEANGWGATFLEGLRQVGYPWLYRNTATKKRLPETTTTMGWWNNKESNWTILDQLRTGLSRGEIRIFSQEALMEGTKYVIAKNADVEFAGLEDGGPKARAMHGDRWRAVSIAWEACKRMPEIPPPTPLRLQGTVDSQLREAEETPPYLSQDHSPGGFAAGDDSSEFSF
jgi:hypothetical protein